MPRNKNKRNSSTLPKTPRLSLEDLEARRVLATFTVTDLGDAPVAQSGDAPGTLRQAIFDANALEGVDDIEFDAGLSGRLNLFAGELTVTEAVNILGPETFRLEISAQDDSRIFNISDESGDLGVSISDLRLQDGNAGTGDGGAIFTTEPLRLRHVSISDSQASNGGGIFGTVEVEIEYSVISGNDASDRTGGGIHARYLTVEDSVVSGNTIGEQGSAPAGGGVYFEESASILRAEFSGNVAPSAIGGAIGGNSFSSGTLTITDSWIHDNESTFAGGVYAATDTIFERTTISNNAGGGILGALGADITLNSSTVSGNACDGFCISGGIRSFDELNVFHSTVVDNSISGDLAYLPAGGLEAGQLTLSHSIVSGNRQFVAGQTLESNFLANSVDATFNLIGSNNGTGLGQAIEGDANGNLVGGTGDDIIDPMLAPLAATGGRWPTHQLVTGSPAIDAGGMNEMVGVDDVPNFDQRGAPFNRITDGGSGATRIDIGAVELNGILSAEAFVVTTVVDGIDAQSSDGLVSLREAINAANGSAGPDVITFDESVFESLQTIALTDGELAISETLTLVGPGQDLLTIDAMRNSRIFAVGTEGTMTQPEFLLSDVTLTGGRSTGAISEGSGSEVSLGAGVGGGAILSYGALTLDGAIVSGNISPTVGGGINARSALTISNSVVAQNEANTGGGVYVILDLDISDSQISGNSTISLNLESDYDGFGGGLFARGVSRISTSLISENSSAAMGGGAYFAFGARVDVVNSTIAGNTAVVGSGGIDASSIFLSGSTVSGNSAPVAGGLRLRSSGAQISNSTISGNFATNGGGIYADFSILVEFSTVTANSALEFGGGIYSRGNLELNHAIVAGNSGLSTDIIGEFTTQFSLIGFDTVDNESTTPNVDGSIIGGPFAGPIDPLLEPLADNGGLTLTHLPAPGSPVIDAGDPLIDDEALLDQRGMPRVVSVIDIGSVETEGSSWHNFANPLDVNDSGNITPLDALLVINELNDPQFSDEDGQLPDVASSPPFLDANDDQFVTPLDALLIINELNTMPATVTAGGSFRFMPQAIDSFFDPVPNADEEDQEEQRTLAEVLADAAFGSE